MEFLVLSLFPAMSLRCSCMVNALQTVCVVITLSNRMGLLSLWGNMQQISVTELDLF